MLETILIITTILELNPLLQAFKIIKLKEAKDISVSTYFMILTIGILWFIYGIQITSTPLIIGNLFKIITSLSVIIVYFVFNQQKIKQT